ncbi:MAG: hypothetical protein WCK91_00295, partial [bacterium]
IYDINAEQYKFAAHMGNGESGNDGKIGIGGNITDVGTLAGAGLVVQLDGNVGIGTTTPGYTLDVSGDINFTGTLYKNGTALKDSPFTLDGSNNIYSSNTTEPGGSYMFTVGYNAGSGANTQKSNFIGYEAGSGATSAYNSNFIGVDAGRNAVSADKSNFIGHHAGDGATGALQSNFIGRYAGYGSTYASYSNIFGEEAGYNATNANHSTFIGYRAGYGATNANNSLFLGNNAGISDSVNNSIGARSSILIGNSTSTGGYSDSIAIGQGAMNSTSRQLNIGNVLYATGIYNSNSVSGSPIAGGKVGIGIANPLGLLQVEGGSIYANAPQSDTVINGGAGNDWQTYANLVGSAGLWAIRTGTDASINFDTNNSFSPITALKIATNGNIGIGASNPLAQLEINNPSGNLPLSINNVGNGETPVIRFGYGGLPNQYTQWITARSNSLPSANNISFYTNDGSGGSTFPTNAVFGMSISNGDVTVGNNLTIGGILVLTDQLA